MPPRPRSLRARRLSPRRPLRPSLEDLEIRLVLSSQEIIAEPTYVTYNPPGGTANLPHLGAVDGIAGPLASSMTPAEMRDYYGVENIDFGGGLVGDGANQTIAIVDAYDDPAMQDSVNGVVTGGDLYNFDKYFGQSNNLNFTKVSQTGSTTSLPAADPTGGWETEESLDIEWAHTIAPSANIVLVEADTASNDLFTAETEAASYPGVSVVTNSWGSLETPDSASLEPFFTTPVGHPGGGITFLASAGDDGSLGKDASNPFVAGSPTLLPDVLSVGGTSIYNDLGSPTLETAWNRGGGGQSSYIAEPAFQDAAQSSGERESPDVSMDADPDFGGVALYDSYLRASPWLQEGGTSLASPMWAGLIAIANQGRVAAGGQTLYGDSQTLPALYSLPSADFNDILSGNNGGHGATVGYDMVTGLGSPRAASLVPDLAAYGLGETLAVSAQPPSSVNAGSSFGLTVSVEDSFGNIDANYNG